MVVLRALASVRKPEALGPECLLYHDFVRWVQLLSFFVGTSQGFINRIFLPGDLTLRQ